VIVTRIARPIIPVRQALLTSYMDAADDFRRPAFRLILVTSDANALLSFSDTLFISLWLYFNIIKIYSIILPLRNYLLYLRRLACPQRTHHQRHHRLTPCIPHILSQHALHHIPAQLRRVQS